MHGRRLALVSAAAALLVTSSLFAQAPDRKAQQKLEKAQRDALQPMMKFLDAWMTGQGASQTYGSFTHLVNPGDGAATPQSAPADGSIGFESHFLKSVENRTYVPFTLTIDKATLTGPSIVLYMRVAPRGATGLAKGSKAEWPWDEVHFVDLRTLAAGQPYRLSRAFAVPGGPYDVYVAIRERPAEKASGKGPIKMLLLRQQVDVPDYFTEELATSSIILADKVEPLQAPLTREQQAERPYAMGTAEIVPAADSSFGKKEELSLIFLIYNAKLDASNKPDVTVEYNFHQKTSEIEKFFNKTNPQNFNPQTLPPQFDMKAGHQLVAGQSVPLTMFPAGDYRLEIKITDKASTKTLTRNVSFTVAGP